MEASQRAAVSFACGLLKPPALPCIAWLGQIGSGRALPKTFSARPRRICASAAEPPSPAPGSGPADAPQPPADEALDSSTPRPMTPMQRLDSWVAEHEHRSGFGKWLRRWVASVLIGARAGAILVRRRFRVHPRNLMEQLAAVGPESLLVSVLTAMFTGGVFTIQVAREFIAFKVQRAIGAVIGLALARELTPVLTAVIVAGRVGSAFAAEIGTMQVSEQIDALVVLRTDPLEYLVVPRLVATCLMLPSLSVLGLLVGLWTCTFIAGALYHIDAYTVLFTCRRALSLMDLAYMLVKSTVFGAVVAAVGCGWGLTTTGGAKGVGVSTTASVVTSLMSIFVWNFLLSWLMFGGSLGSALKNIL
eukprot:tig00000391_g24848.t1